MTKLAPEWVRTSDPVIRSPARYRWTTAPALEWGIQCAIVDFRKVVRNVVWGFLHKAPISMQCDSRQLHYYLDTYNPVVWVVAMNTSL